MPEVIIIGGGIAGLSLGIMLARKGHPTKVIETGSYPRHKVCGEFLSGEGLAILESLELPLGEATYARSALFCSGNQKIQKQLPAPALCISRFKLDHLLSESFVSAGGILQTATRWTNGFDKVIRATGRRFQPSRGGWRWLGLKAHAHNVKMEADLELHFDKNSYVGLCRVEEGKVNVCGLFRSRTPWGGTPAEILRGPPETELFERLRNANFIESSFCSVTGFAFKESPATDQCAIGDAFGMIPPFTGNGLSIALESADITLPMISSFADGNTAWEECVERVNVAQVAAFKSRIKFAKILQQFMFFPFGGRLLMHGLQVPRFWEHLFQSTRSGRFRKETDALLQHS